MNQQNFLQFKGIFSLTVYQRKYFLGELKFPLKSKQNYNSKFPEFKAIQTLKIQKKNDQIWTKKFFWPKYGIFERF